MGAVDAETELARLRAEVESLRQSLAKEREIRRSVLDHAPDFIVQCNVHGTILFINRVAPGFDLEDVLGAPVTRFLAPEAREIALRTIANVVATRSVQTYESMGAGPNGEPTHYFTRVAPVFADGEVTSVLLFATNVDRLKKAEAAIEDRDAQLRIIVEAAKMGVWWVDFAAGTADADELGRTILGLPEGPLTLELGLRSVPDEDREEIRIAVEGSQVTGSYGPIDHRVVHASGATRWVRTVGHLRPGTQRLIGGVVDITEQKRLEIQVAQAQKMDGIGRLAGGVAHDFNNLLTAILGSIYHARRQLPAGAPTLDELAHIQAAAERAAALTAQLLAFARRQVVETRVVAFATVVSEIERLLRRVLGEDIELSSVHGAKGHVRSRSASARTRAHEPRDQRATRCRAVDASCARPVTWSSTRTTPRTTPRSPLDATWCSP
ncbi:MAG: PAS domain S-box protein [Myxococcales bacterium]|nr:PAS domain S-box protein [Myxococcales bacterium]